MLVKGLIKKLKAMPPKSRVVVSRSGGCKQSAASVISLNWNQDGDEMLHALHNRNPEEVNGTEHDELVVVIEHDQG